MFYNWFRGAYLQFGITVGNNGNVQAMIYHPRVHLYLSNSPTCDGGYLISSWAQNLPAYSVAMGTVGGTIPQWIPLGCYYTCWKIDAEDGYVEWNESDNTVHGCHRICVVG